MKRKAGAGVSIALRLLLGAALGAVLPAWGDELNILSWEGYADDSFVKPFVKETGCQVSSTYVGGNDEFVAKVMSGGGAYDLVTPSNDTTMRLIDAGVIEPLDPARIPNMADFYDIFKAAPWTVKNGKTYGVPYGWGIVRVIVDGAAVHGPLPDSLSLLWDPRLKGKVSIWDDVEAIYTASRYLGYKNTYDLSDEQLEKVKAALIALKPNIRKYWATTGEMGTLMGQREVAAGLSWESTLADLWKAGRDIRDIPVREGRSGWADSWMVVKGAGARPCVYKWLNYVSSPQAQAIAHKVTGFGYSNKKMADYLDPASKAMYQRLGMGRPEILAQVDWWQSVRRRAKYLEIWNQVKAQ